VSIQTVKEERLLQVKGRRSLVDKRFKLLLEMKTRKMTTRYRIMVRVMAQSRKKLIMMSLIAHKVMN